MLVGQGAVGGVAQNALLPGGQGDAGFGARREHALGRVQPGREGRHGSAFRPLGLHAVQRRGVCQILSGEHGFGEGSIRQQQADFARLWGDAHPVRPGPVQGAGLHREAVGKALVHHLNAPALGGAEHRQPVEDQVGFAFQNEPVRQHGKAGQQRAGCRVGQLGPGLGLAFGIKADAALRLGAVRTQQPDKGPGVVLLGPELGEEQGQRVEGALGVCHGMPAVAGEVFVPVEEEVPHPQTALFAQKAHPVAAGGIPLGAQVMGGVPVAGSLPGHGRGDAVFFAEPLAAGRHGLHPGQALLGQTLHQIQLGQQAGADVLPQKVVLLAHLGVADAQRVLFGDGVEHPANPLLVPAGEPGGLQGEHHAV